MYGLPGVPTSLTKNIYFDVVKYYVAVSIELCFLELRENTAKLLNMNLST